MNLSQPGTQPASKTQFVLRFPDGEVRKELKVRAAKNERSLNSEILYLIKRGLQVEQQHQGAQA
jgi:plasmid stability protein